MTKSETIAAALAALTLATTFTAIGGQAAAHPHFGHNGWGIGAGFAAGALIGAAAASNYSYAPGYTERRYVGRYDRWGNLRTVKVWRHRPVLILIQRRSAQPRVHARADR